MPTINQQVKIQKAALNSINRDDGKIIINMTAQQNLENGKYFDLSLWLDSLPKPKLKNATLDIIAKALDMFDGNKTMAAEYLGSGRRAITYRQKNLQTITRPIPIEEKEEGK